ncbi:hypothetical protein F5Y19DRAFT_329247 [Xylariaceae sp. FL1651]|nr:hypothetical protein F5Y19DRAFT_329247 [Xylariaceae sp. FL1651]
MALQGKLDVPNRFITTCDENGKAIVDRTIPPEAPFYKLPNIETAFAHLYVTSGFPTKLQSDADIHTYQHYLNQPPGMTVSNGTVLRYVDMPPGATSPMHRTVSIDYGVVLEGNVELVLDSGETRPMKRGDVCIQRATMHAWRNLSKTEWVRMLYVLLPTEPYSAKGEPMVEDYGEMTGVEPSA